MMRASGIAQSAWRQPGVAGFGARDARDRGRPWPSVSSSQHQNRHHGSGRERRACGKCLIRHGAPGRDRTCDPRLRRPMLYPTELQARAAIIATYTAGGNRGRGDCVRNCARQSSRPLRGRRERRCDTHAASVGLLVGDVLAYGVALRLVIEPRGRTHRPHAPAPARSRVGRHAALGRYSWKGGDENVGWLGDRIWPLLWRIRNWLTRGR